LWAWRRDFTPACREANAEKQARFIRGLKEKPPADCPTLALTLHALLWQLGIERASKVLECGERKSVVCLS
jgi:hypothetical protein